MLFAMQKTDFNVLELFRRANYCIASMSRITSLELLGTIIAMLEQKSKKIDFKTKCAEKFLSQSEKVD